MDLYTIQHTVPIMMSLGITMKVTELLLALLFLRSKLNIKKLSEFGKPNSLLQLMALQTLMISIILLCLFNVNVYLSNTLLYTAFIVVVFILFLLLYIIDYKERDRLNAVQNRFKLQEEYIRNIESILNIIRREKHDFSNHLNTILAMCTLNKPDTVQKIGAYIKKLSVKLINSYHFYNSGNDYVDGMLAVKSNKAFELGIQMDADFKASFSNLDISDCDITSIVGNITDNAFEAIEEEGDCEGKSVKISTYEDDYHFFILISNNGPLINEKDLNRIFSSGYSTKTSNKSEHGFGLFIVNQLVQRYNGSISVSSTEEKTEFIIKFVKDVKLNGKAG